MPRRSIVASLLVTALVAALAGCGSSSSSTTTAKTATAATTPPVGKPRGFTIAFEKIPVFEPTKIENSKVKHVLYTLSPKDLPTITKFYETVLPEAGWTISSKTVTPTSMEFVVKRPGRVGSVTAAPVGSSTTLTIRSQPIG
jgi:hypothetical protein